MLSGPSAWRRLQAWPVPHASGHCLLPCWCSMLLQTHWLCGSASRRTWQKTSCIKHAKLVLRSARVWLYMSACLATLHGHGLHVVRRSMLTMLYVCSPITCRASQRGNSMLPSGTWCCGSCRCSWHTSTAARAWQHLACRHLRPSLPVMWGQTKLLSMTQQRK